MSGEKEIALEHGWRYFQYHAEQRITVFNFFVATAGLLVTGLAFTAQASPGTWPLGLAAGLLLILISFAFWRLDQRVSSMIKLAEDVVVRAEAQLISDADLRMISREQILTAATQFGWFKSWTYGRAFRFIFASMGIVGLVGCGFSISRAMTSPSERLGKTHEGSGSRVTKAAETPAPHTPAPSPSMTLQTTQPRGTPATN